MKTNYREEAELRVREDRPNFEGYKHPLTFRPLKLTDTSILAPVMKKSAPYIKGYIHWGTYASKWNFSDVQSFVSARVHDDFPRFHFLFLIGNQPVAMGSLAPMPSKMDTQISLVVFHPHQGRGIGPVVVKTLEWYAFNVWGFSNLWYQYDATNKNSQKLAKKMEFEFVKTFEDQISAEEESGLWFSHKKPRPEDAPKGILQGEDIAFWSTPKNPGVLRAIIENRLDDQAS